MLRGYFGRPPRSHKSDVRSTRFPILVVLLAIVAAVAWYYVSQRAHRGSETIAVYYTKLDGKSLASVGVSLRPRQPDESDAEHLHNTVLYAAVQAVARRPRVREFEGDLLRRDLRELRPAIADIHAPEPREGIEQPAALGIDQIGTFGLGDDSGANAVEFGMIGEWMQMMG